MILVYIKKQPKISKGSNEILANNCLLMYLASATKPNWDDHGVLVAAATIIWALDMISSDPMKTNLPPTTLYMGLFFIF